MPAATDKPRAPTWLDLMPEGMPEPDLLTHDEFLEQLRERGVELSSASFHYYRHRGILPRPIRRRVDGVTQAVYPHWLLPVVERIRAMQAQEMSLDDIQRAIQPITKMWALSPVLWKDPLSEPTAALDVALREWAKAKQRELSSATINAIRVTLLDDDGNEVGDSHTIPVGS